MYSTFPRVVGKYRGTIVNNQSELQDYINSSNGKSDCFVTIYSYSSFINDKVDYNTARIDRLLFDFDDGDTYESMRLLHNHLVFNDLKHIVLFTGRGYHVYIFCTEILEDKKQRLIDAQHMFITELGLKVDKHIIGNLAQIARLPYTYNIKRRRFCGYLNEHDILMGDEFIKKNALKQFKRSNYVFGTKLLDIETVPKTPFVAFNHISAYDTLDDPVLQYLLNNRLDRKDMEKNSVLFKNLAVLLVEACSSEDEITEYVQKIIKNCPGHNVSEFRGWVNKARSRQISYFNMIELNQWIMKYKLKIPLYDLDELRA